MTPSALTGINLKLLLTASGLAFAMAGPADARKREPAPIIYAGQGAQPASTGQRPAPAPSRPEAAGGNPRSLAPSGKRIEFRYPDQPDVFFGADGPRQTSDAAPMSFSSGSTAISAADARQYASARMPDHSTAPASRDPAITAGGFDARAAASRVAARRAAEDARIERPEQSDANLRQVAMNTPASNPVLDAPVPAMPAASARALQNLPYQPVAQPEYDARGYASVYDPAFGGQPTANGEILDMDGMMAAHPTLPLPSLVQVINEENGREVVVRVNDRGPFEDNRLIQLSGYAAQMLGIEAGRAPRVRVRYLGAAPVLASAGPAAARPQLSNVAYTPPARESRRPVIETAALPPRLPVPDPVSAMRAVPAGHYFIQAGSFSDIGNAQRLHAILSASYDVDIVPVVIQGADFFRVMIGPLSGKAAAADLRDRLAYQGVANGIVVSRD